MEKAIKLLAGRGIKLNSFQFQDEIDAGTIKYAEYLRMFNVESPESLKKRREKRAKITAPYRDKVIKCVVFPGLIEQIPPELFDAIDKIIYGSISRGARGEAEVIGVSVGRIWYESMLVDMMNGDEIPGAYYWKANEDKIKNVVSSEVAKGVAEELLEKLPEIFLPEGYAEIIKRFLRNWENMPEVDI
jgi:hypothetical protein